MKHHISPSPDGVKPPLIMSYCFAFIGSNNAFFHVASVKVRLILRYTLPEILAINLLAYFCNITCLPLPTSHFPVIKVRS